MTSDPASSRIVSLSQFTGEVDSSMRCAVRLSLARALIVSFCIVAIVEVDNVPSLP